MKSLYNLFDMDPPFKLRGKGFEIHDELSIPIWMIIWDNVHAICRANFATGEGN